MTDLLCNIRLLTTKPQFSNLHPAISISAADREPHREPRRRQPAEAELPRERRRHRPGQQAHGQRERQGPHQRALEVSEF